MALRGSLVRRDGAGEDVIVSRWIQSQAVMSDWVVLIAY